MIPLRLRMSRMMVLVWLPADMGSACISSQWSNTHWGKAWPEVAARSVAVKPKDSMTGR